MSQQAKIFKPPSPFKKRRSLFLAGSIEMGAAKMWQLEVQEQLANYPVDIYNPRRDDWDMSWNQSITNPDFYEQVTWELEALDAADFILMYFDPRTKSPISLMELGLYADSRKLFVVCPEGFWRKGNVEIVCERYGIPFFESLGEALAIIEAYLNQGE